MDRFLTLDQYNLVKRFNGNETVLLEFTKSWGMTVYELKLKLKVYLHTWQYNDDDKLILNYLREEYVNWLERNNVGYDLRPKTTSIT